jgi:uncharacterized membrane protein YgdD (TMEM256/DUF423 family)
MSVRFKESPMGSLFFFLGAILAGCAVAIGAYSAHGSGLEQIHIQWLDKGCRYQMYHAIGLMLAGLALTHGRAYQPLIMTAGLCFIAGIVCFSGSLYAMVFTSFEAGYITPAGGLLLMLGWLLLAIGGPGGR